MRPMKRFAAALMALAVICSAALLPQPAAALVTQADIDALKGDAKDLTAQRKALEPEEVFRTTAANARRVFGL